MANRTITFETVIPEDIYAVLRAHGFARENLAEQSRRLLAMQFYQDRLLSLGQAARFAGMSRWEFVEFLSEHDAPVIDYHEEELNEEFAAVEALKANRTLHTEH